MQFIILVLASVFTLIFVVNLMRGGKYSYLVQNLDDGEFFLKDLYIVGLSMNDSALFKLKGGLAKKLKKQAKLYYDNVYYEYYATITWAQFLSLSTLVLALGLGICGLVGGDGMILFLLIVVLFVAAIWNMTMSKMKEAVEKRREECVAEFPNMISKLSLLLNSGMVLREAWTLVANGKNGALYELMRKACEYMRNGDSDSAAIYKFGVLSDAPEIKKFTSAMMQGIEKGNSELADFLVAQASELWAHKRQSALQKGEIAAGKLIIPLGITFAGIILIIVAGTMQSMNF